ncbi:hypothetical protein VOLCADRAFT_98890 [Volvox carteri f. nagariensis]|uniref:Uncharacterized protein n=1 Tax=Volvox carteri f. nagariensis TaxID=3068 RepID=D8UGI9_VOLCA|nr:uncharacterized protein VOLCADRAFT_98890 [Volvox carteri f. nagariensis]EFJ41182.1 hypothetical protein VOLCADRAFT_98890 [Volvox carteri f. nagariensis]|eukprot:XP_002957750.1 hypothetical protein VOLCADRAFT_98890 [Volvox carteri f. nagariensis]
MDMDLPDSSVRARDDCSLELPKTFQIDRIPPGNENHCVHQISTLQDPSAMLRRREARAPIVNASNQRSQAHIVFRCWVDWLPGLGAYESSGLPAPARRGRPYFYNARLRGRPYFYNARLRWVDGWVGDVGVGVVRLGHQPVRPSGTERALLMMGPAEVGADGLGVLVHGVWLAAAAAAAAAYSRNYQLL